ncbi:MAG: single-stranded DNA-binding protein [Bacteroidales bacterium]|nr:single-stranded DNA-binding protein [Bacteroidales bacterium]MDD3664416.1 single-stranded DNA-binding protein [Bacteroidales bacterium]
MSNGVNKVILVGNLGRDPEIQNFDGVKKASFSMATTEKYKDKNGQIVSQTEWHNIVLWRGLAEVVEKYLHKGDLVYIEGKIKTRMYEENGSKKYFTEILADAMNMLSTKRDEDPATFNNAAENTADDKGLPF